jgi:hypothetical protein
MKNISIELYGKEFDVSYEGDIYICSDNVPYGDSTANIDYIDSDLKIIEINGEYGEVEILDNDPFIDHVYEKLLETLSS